MSTNLKVADVETSLSQIRRMMAEEDIGRIPIIKDGILVGIITRTDLVRASNGVFNFSVNPLLKEKYESQNLKKYMEEFLPPLNFKFTSITGRLWQRTKCQCICSRWVCKRFATSY